MQSGGLSKKGDIRKNLGGVVHDEVVGEQESDRWTPNKIPLR
jgi:hypothetical protein